MPPSRAFRPSDPPLASAQESSDPFLEFPKESDVYPELSREVNTEIALWGARRFAIVAIGIGLLVGVVLSAIRYVPEVTWRANRGAPPAPVLISKSTATLTSTPDDADVYIDGVHVGTTPISLSLPVGVRVAELRRGHASSRASLNIEAGKITAQHVDFAGERLTGGLEITSDPQRARVSIDGKPRGQTPLKIPEVAPGQHRVTVSSGRDSFDRAVEVTAGATATVVVVWKQESASRGSLRRTEAEPAAPSRAIYTALDRDVMPPVELERNIPAWNPPPEDSWRWFRGVVQVVVDERGSVERAQLVWPLADFYDAGLLEAARGWQFKPALRTGQPVKYRKVVEITMRPQQ